MPAWITGWDGLFWLLVFVSLLLFVQRRLHFELQAVFLILTRRRETALGLFALLFFPGVFLHEASHYLMARLLGVRTGRFSLLPRVISDGQLQLGFVETASADPLRDALIGAAPLLSGGAVIAFLGLHRLGLLPLATYFLARDWNGLFKACSSLPELPDFWVWFYLAFAISTTMLPSAADRRAWLPLGLVLLALIALALLAGAGPWMIEHLAAWLNQVFRALAVVFGISLVLHLTLWLPLRLLRGLLVFVPYLVGF
ncbi:MAG TPA: hypothetical protein DEQ80_03530 [Anaerolinea thermolimosa]|uniref:Uncharacterized protein n=1 Tax=Anaerolinea thermolimosa TaxID=229919 RepID=A0A3D1JE99_9CHLR|nr:hypothetical protein [Anaerolinea thermolimosa]GAP07349.1 hypothetical protein ATHL_02221 [Anaerolinea thermolimosa]HCE16910.1 hypothetical protein [Anaerolinea thermolimosa]